MLFLVCSYMNFMFITNQHSHLFGKRNDSSNCINRLYQRYTRQSNMLNMQVGVLGESQHESLNMRVSSYCLNRQRIELHYIQKQT